MSASFRLRSAALVAVGGAVGTLARAELARLTPITAAAWPWPTFVVNITGAFALPLVAAVLGRHRLADGLLPLVTTGMLGGFTTYSAFALETVLLVETRHTALALAYAAATLVGGLVASMVGLSLASRPEVP